MNSEKMASAHAGLSVTNEHQTLHAFEKCLNSLGECHNENVYAAIERLVEAGEQVGFTVNDLIRMLRGGMSLEGLLDVIQIRMASTQYKFNPN